MRNKGFYKNYIKRFLDIVLSLLALVCLFLFLVVFTICGAIIMKGNPFFVQERPGKDEKIFKLIKFRTMSCQKDKNGKLLPDEYRLTKYGEFIRSASIDELPELINILKGDMSIVGPRPLLIKYLPLYNEEQRHRHDVRPGLSGLAQINGRNAISWEEKFRLDVEYVNNITFLNDVKIVLGTIGKVLKRVDISSETSVTMEAFTGTKTEKEEQPVNV